MFFYKKDIFEIKVYLLMCETSICNKSFNLKEKKYNRRVNVYILSENVGKSAISLVPGP